MNSEYLTHREILKSIARRAMQERGLLTDFSAEVSAQLAHITDGAVTADIGCRDLRDLPWASIDNDDSRDLDQLTTALPSDDGVYRILVAVADVDALVARGTAIDTHAQHNTTSVYTSAAIFPMLPERLSTDLTSLNAHVDRLSLVIDMSIAANGTLAASDIYRARVRNQARLTYNAVAAWLDDPGAEPLEIARVPGLAENLRTQDRAARALRALRHEHGALEIETIQARTVFSIQRLTDLAADKKNRAQELIEDFMIAANSVTARFLKARGCPSLRRVVRSPKRWDRIAALAAECGATLPPQPDTPALSAFLQSERERDPLRFPDLSLAVVKLLGAGEYVAEQPGDETLGHFGLAVKDYGHSTAPNRRYPDLITQRLLKATLARASVPYAADELTALAARCTRREDDANKVERQVRKSAAALLLEDRHGERFDAIVTGAAAKGTWVRVLQPPVEGRLTRGEQGLDVGDRVRVELVDTDVERGFIDFARSA
ncbi:MAG: RNB domain-containing ribonuclease [Vicinamibacteria bacterium]|jgi:exoribonuclease-2|nr:RNB domain-containing ribonuclease [Vicinamibacteria bacterium]